MQAIAFIGHRGFEEVRIDRSIGFLNHLHAGVEEGNVSSGWRSVLLVIA